MTGRNRANGSVALTILPQLNAAYPATAPWQFETVSLTVEDTRAVTETRVTSADVDAIAISFFIVENGRITAMREFLARSLSSSRMAPALGRALLTVTDKASPSSQGSPSAARV